MIGGLLFRYWEGGATARSGNPNVYINWAQKKRPEQRPTTPSTEPRAAEPEQAVLVPLPAICQPGRVGVAGTAPTTFVRAAHAQPQALVARAATGACSAVAYPTGVRAALPDVLVASAGIPAAVVALDPDSVRRLAIIEHNRRAIAAIAAAMLADDA